MATNPLVSRSNSQKDNKMLIYVLVNAGLSVSQVVSKESAIEAYEIFLLDHCNKLKNADLLAKNAIENMEPGIVYDLTFGDKFGETILTCVKVDLTPSLN